MEIIRADNSGFCFGVKNALDKTLAEIEKKAKNHSPARIYTMGPLIHNESVTEDLKAKGVAIIGDIEEAEPGDTVIIRSHGESYAFYEKIRALDLHVVDTTCPFVSRIHEIVKRAYDEGRKVIIAGDKNHPEVKATNGWTGNSAYIVSNREEAEQIPAGDYLLVCQTTIRKGMLDEIVQGLQQKGRRVEVMNTICRATTLRQNSCADLAKQVDAMIIIGGKTSSNTRKLYEISQKHCPNSYFIENYRDLSLKEIRKYNRIGIAAGASTPECVIKEVIASMSENEKTTMADFMDEIDASLKLPHTGEIVNGKVHEVTDKYVVVNLGCKKDGILPDTEVTLKEGETLNDQFQPGDDIEVKVVKTDDGDGSILLSKKKLEISKHWAEIKKANEEKSLITVKVLRAVNGGVIAGYKEVTGFIPMSQLSDRYVENADEFIGQVFDVRVTRVDDRRNRAVFSHKAVLIEQKKQLQEKVWETINTGDIVEGTVMRFTEYGAFVDIGGIDGLLHISEISWGKLKHPKEVLSIGQKIHVKILNMNREKNKISLGLKQTMPEPWSVISTNYTPGEIVPGKVVQLKEYGAFVELEPGLDGLVHISEVAHKRVANISDELSVGQEVKTKILDIDTERRRISLSIKAAADEIGEEAALGVKAEDRAEAVEEEKAPEPVEAPVESKPTEAAEPTAIEAAFAEAAKAKEAEEAEEQAVATNAEEGEPAGDYNDSYCEGQCPIEPAGEETVDVQAKAMESAQAEAETSELHQQADAALDASKEALQEKEECGPTYMDPNAEACKVPEE